MPHPGLEPSGASREFVRHVMQQEGVRKRIAEVADRKAKAVQQLAEQAGATVTVVRTDGTRPKGRPYAQISIPATAEHGDSKNARLRLLGRVLNGR